MNSNSVKQTMKAHKICVLIPTYNNAGTLGDVLTEVLKYSDDVIVVNDGSTDATHTLLQEFADKVTLVEYDTNKGKGYALKQGFKEARERGYDYAITMDSDGQHYPSEISAFVRAIIEHPGALIIGERDLSKVDINGKSSFANKFSNFWFTVQTGRKLKDTQTGYRAYPLKHLYGFGLMTNRYEAELLLLVFSAWNSAEIVSMPIPVFYPSQRERISHFRPALDFTRISILNTILCIGAILYGLPVRIWQNIRRMRIFGNPMSWFAKKDKPANITIGRLCRTGYTLLHFVFWSIIVFKPYVWLNFKFSKPTAKKSRSLHEKIYHISSFFTRNFPGGKTSIENYTKEDFRKPAIIVCNHQSHLDLPILMSLSPNLIFMANDWVWKNKFFGNIVQSAGYVCMTEGIDSMLPKIKSMVEQGCSVVIFPEGTRSDDCKIQRFHQGAFSLAQQLGLDILPMVLHGAGHYLPKHENMLRKNPMTLRVLPRISQESVKEMPFRKQASLCRGLINEELQSIASGKETPKYYASLVLYKYAYRGWATVSQCKNALSQIGKYEEIISHLDGHVAFVNSGIGVIPLLCALANPSVHVYAFVTGKRDYETFTATVGLPNNLSIHKVVFQEDYDIMPIDTRVFILGKPAMAQLFEKYNHSLISLNDE